MSELEQKLSELWVFVQLNPTDISEEINRVKKDIGRLNKKSEVKGKILWDKNVGDHYSFVLRMKNQTPTDKLKYTAFLNRISNADMTSFVYSRFSFSYGQTDRQITTTGQDVLGKSDTSMYIKQFLNLISEGYPTDIIEKMGLFENLCGLDTICQQQGYITKNQITVQTNAKKQ